MNDTELIDYFKGLGIREILSLAKKSIQITANNTELEHKIEDLEAELSDITKITLKSREKIWKLETENYNLKEKYFDQKLISNKMLNYPRYEDMLEEVRNRLSEQLKKKNEIKAIVLKDLQENHCANCDGAGLGDCQNDKCSTYQMNEILKILERMRNNE